MKTILYPLLITLADLLRSRAALHLEMLALRQQLAMVTPRGSKRFCFRQSERVFWIWLYRLWPNCLQTLGIFKPDTLVRWHRKILSRYIPSSYVNLREQNAVQLQLQTTGQGLKKEIISLMPRPAFPTPSLAKRACSKNG